MKFEPTLHKLPSGLTVILDPMDLETTTISVLFKTGARDETPAEMGITHFCEHMLCKGTTRFPTPRAFDDFMDFNGGTKNARTNNTALELCGRILAENANLLLDVFADQLQNSLFDPEKIELERTVIKDELRRASDKPERQLIDFISGKLFNYATGSLRILGTYETIDSFTREQMLAFLQRRLSAQNCIISVSGKIIDADAMLAHITEKFAFLGTHFVPMNTDITYTPTVAHNLRPDDKNVKLRILFPDVWPLEYECRFNNKCVGKFERFLGRQLFDVVRRENGLVYGLQMTGYGNEKFGVSGVATETAPENIERVVALIAKTAHRVYTENPITDDDLIRFTHKNKLGNADWLESASQRMATLIGFYADYDRLYDFYESNRMVDSIRRDDVIKNSRGYFDGAMSIITQGAAFSADLADIWHENFK